MIPNALQPAQIEEVFLYPRLGRAIVLVKEDQLSLAIGRRGQNVRLASKLVGWDIEIMTADELSEGIERAENWFRQIPGVSDEQVEAFIEEGFLSYDDLTFLEPAELAELAGVTEDQAEEIIAFAEEAAERVEEETRLAKEREAAEGGPAAPLSAAAKAAAKLFPDEQGAAKAPAEAKPTFESLFGPDVPAPPAEAPLGGEEVLEEKEPATATAPEESQPPEAPPAGG
jgi:N utilization substance protein A